MAEFMLDFEKPIYELEAKLAEWEKLDAEQSMNFSDELKMLRKKFWAQCTETPSVAIN